MRKTIAILDDEPDRLTAMLKILSHRFPQYQVATFDNAPAMNTWLTDNIRSCILICLDHDLGPNRQLDDGVFDPGTGRDVADLIASHDPVCPIIIHTTNRDARPGMILSLEDAGWSVSYVSPYNDVSWIGEIWSDAIGDVLRQQPNSAIE